MTIEEIKEIPKESDQKDIMFMDRIIRLIDGSLLIGRLILDKKKDNENFIYVYIPLLLTMNDDGDVYMEHWIPMSKDVVYPIQIKNVLGVSRPDDELSIRYSNGFEVNEFLDSEYDIKSKAIAEFETDINHEGNFH